MTTTPSRPTRLPRPPRTALILLAIVMGLPMAGQASGSRALERTGGEGQAAGGRIVGTWEFQVGFINCETGAPLAPPFRSLHTYIPGGSMLEQGAAAGPPPAASRTVGQGVWQRERAGLFESLFTFFTFDATGQYLTRVVVEEIVEFTGGNELDLQAVAGVFAPNGAQVATNCVIGSGERLTVPE